MQDNIQDNKLAVHRVGVVYIVHNPLPLRHNPTELTQLSL
jgi:hypothetical protein